MKKTKPLYRKINSRTHGIRHGSCRRASYERGAKKKQDTFATTASMHSEQRHGLDYTPLFRFLLLRVGQNWDQTYSDAIARLDRPDPIFWMVATTEADRRSIVRTGEITYFSGLFVDQNGRLAIVDPDVTHETIKPSCACCTHTMNGERLTQSFSDEQPT